MPSGHTTEQSKGQRAYMLRRDTGMSWDKVAVEIGSTSSDAAITGAKKFASKRSLPWPIRTVLDKARAKAKQDEVRAQRRRDARVYRRVASGTPVNAIPGMSVTEVYRRLDRHVETTGDPPVARNAERAYGLRTAGELTWRGIAATLGYLRETAAIEAAREFAKERGLPWPVEVNPAQREPEAYVGKGYYDAVQAGTPWEAIAERAGKVPSYIKGRAKVYANAHNLPWPP
jgi:hypothetical protein